MTSEQSLLHAEGGTGILRVQIGPVHFEVGRASRPSLRAITGDDALLAPSRHVVACMTGGTPVPPAKLPSIASGSGPSCTRILPVTHRGEAPCN